MGTLVLLNSTRPVSAVSAMSCAKNIPAIGKQGGVIIFSSLLAIWIESKPHKAKAFRSCKDL